MASYRIETIADPDTGHVSAEVRREGDGAVIARSGPVFASAEEAEARILDAIARAWPQQPADPVYPANGS